MGPSAGESLRKGSSRALDPEDARVPERESLLPEAHGEVERSQVEIDGDRALS